jgi:hypothetical protein
VRRSILRFVIVVIVVGAAALVFGSRLAELTLPLIGQELSSLDDTFRIRTLNVTRDGLDEVFRVEVTLAKPFTLKGRTYFPDPRSNVSASTLVGNLLLPMVLTLATALAFGVNSSAGLLLRATAVIIALTVIFASGVPIILWTSLWDFIDSQLEPGFTSISTLWLRILLGGGQIALALAFGALAGCVGRQSSHTVAMRP